MSNVSEDEYEHALRCLKTSARVVLHFHPDRIAEDQQLVATGLLESGLYKNQYQTKISNGGVSAFPGGLRDQWEQKLYGGAYTFAQTPADERPKYGAFDIFRHPDGPAPRFGSCYLVLRPEVSQRSTFTYLDSHQLPDERGTLDAFEGIFSALLAESFSRGSALGERDWTPSRLLEYLTSGLDRPYEDPAGKAPGRNLNHYIEAQIHGRVALQNDVELLVADASFRGTDIESLLGAICSRYAIRLLWHDGFKIHVGEVPSDFRGPTMPSLAARIASDGWVSTTSIGLAAQQLKIQPELWSDRGKFDDVLQELKLLWHVLVRYGTPAV